MIRLVSADDVKAIICNYDIKAIQLTIIYEIEKLNGCIATNDQMVEILGNEEIKFED